MKKNKFVKKENGWTLCDSKGVIVKRLGNIEAHQLLSVLVVSKNGLLGLIDLNGNMVVPCTFVNIYQHFNRDYKDKYLFLKEPSEKIWISDENGRILTTKGYDEISAMSWSTSYEHISACVDLIVRNTKLNLDTIYYHGLFDLEHGKEIIPAIYSPGTPGCVELLDGIYSKAIPVYDDSKGFMRCKLIDVNGNDLIPFEAGYSEIGLVSRLNDEYLFAAKKDGKYGYINIDNVVKIPFKYDVAKSFDKGYAIVGYGDGAAPDAMGHLYGVIDRHGRTVIPFRYSFIYEVFVIDEHCVIRAIGADNKIEYYDESNNICT